MTHTTNFNLSQWAKTDRIRMADFNADNAKLDAALASCCRFYTTTYTGNDSDTVTLTFPAKPAVVLIACTTTDSADVLLGVSGAAFMTNVFAGMSAQAEWSGSSLKWYVGSEGPSFYCNAEPYQYTVAALLNA